MEPKNPTRHVVDMLQPNPVEGVVLQALRRVADKRYVFDGTSGLLADFSRLPEHIRLPVLAEFVARRGAPPQVGVYQLGVMWYAVREGTLSNDIAGGLTDLPSGVLHVIRDRLPAQRTWWQEFMQPKREQIRRGLGLLLVLVLVGLFWELLSPGSILGVSPTWSDIFLTCMLVCYIAYAMVIQLRSVKADRDAWNAPIDRYIAWHNERKKTQP